jgi:hypothetical protein
MTDQQLEVTCPCCSSRLWIDARTSKVVRSRRPGEADPETGKPKLGDADWSEAMGKVRQRSESGESRLDSALERERDKGSRLDELFRKAKEKLGPDEKS